MIPRNLLAELAPYDPINDDEMGGCIFCCATPPGEQYGYAGRYLEDHKARCPWVRARKRLGDYLPASRCTDPVAPPP